MNRCIYSLVRTIYAFMSHQLLEYPELYLSSLLRIASRNRSPLVSTNESIPGSEMFGFFEGVNFDPSQGIPDLSGKAALVTGGNAGLGKETLIQLAKHNPSQHYLAVRSPSKAETAIHDIKAIVRNANITFLQLDLANLRSAKQASDTFLASSDRLDLLINNAGIMAQPAGQTSDGYELQFGTNHMGHALLTKLLLPTLKRTAQQPRSDVRVVYLSSAGYKNAPPEGIAFPTLATSMEDSPTFMRYGQSKAVNMSYASELARRYPDITSMSCHPGIIDTELSTLVPEWQWLQGACIRAGA